MLDISGITNLKFAWNITASEHGRGERGIIKTDAGACFQGFIDCSREISVLLKKCILSYPHHWTDLVFLCIGTDRVTGDCLGPYVGHRLSSFCFPGIYVYGTLVQPVHALNLCDTRKEILSRHPDSLIIAVDASLGQKKHLGYVTIANGALYPGAAVHKKLPPVGHIHITGIVNTAGMLEQLTLQTTRLSTVISIAEQISNGILLMIPQSDFRQTL